MEMTRMFHLSFKKEAMQLFCTIALINKDRGKKSGPPRPAGVGPVNVLWLWDQLILLYWCTDRSTDSLLKY